MASTPSDSWTKVQPTGSSNNAPSRGRGTGLPRGGRGGSRGRGRGRAPSISSLSDSATSPVPASPAKERPTLLARMDTRSSTGSPTSTSSPLSNRPPASPVTSSEASSPGGSNRPAQRKRKTSNANSPKSPSTTTLPSPLRRNSAHKSPVPSPLSKDLPPHLPVSEAPSLSVVAEVASPPLLSPTPKSFASHSFLLPTTTDLKPPSPMPSPRPFTPQGRDWAADDDDDDDGSLPSLDDWGFAGVKAVSEVGDERVPKTANVASFAKLSLATDSSTVLRGRRSGSAPPSAIERPDGPGGPSFGNIIPPTPVAVRPGQQGPVGGSGLRTSHSPLNQSYQPSNLGSGGDANRAGRSLSRNTSPQPLDFNQARAPSPGAAPGSGGLQSGGRSTSPRPMSGGVSLGSAGFGGNLRASSPGLDPIRSRPNSPGLPLSRPGSPALLGATDPAKSRPTSPRPLSGGVLMGPSRSTSPNPEGFRSNSPLPSTIPRSPPSNLTTTRPDVPSWRSPMRQPAGLPPQTAVTPSLAPTVPLLSRMSEPLAAIPPYRGGRGGGSGPRGGGMRGGARGGMGRGEGNGSGGPSHPPSQGNRPFTSNHPTSNSQASRGGSVKSPTSPSTNRPPLNISSPTRGGRGGFTSNRGHSRNGSEAGSPTSVTSASSITGRGRGHTRVSSRPIISSGALSLINASLSLSPPKRTPAATPPVAGT